MTADALPVFPLEPDVRADIESVLDAGESMADFIASALRDTIALRRGQDAFLARADDSIERAVRANRSHTATEALRVLDAQLAAARQLAASRAKTR